MPLHHAATKDCAVLFPPAPGRCAPRCIDVPLPVKVPKMPQLPQLALPKLPKLSFPKVGRGAFGGEGCARV